MKRVTKSEFWNISTFRGWGDEMLQRSLRRSNLEFHPILMALIIIFIQVITKSKSPAQPFPKSQIAFFIVILTP